MTGNPDAYTSYKDTCRLIDDKQIQEEHVDSPLADDDNVGHEQIDDKQTQEEYVGNPLVDENDDDHHHDHEQIELRPTKVVESEPAGDLHACKTQTSSADLEPAKPTSPVIGSETHVDTHDDATMMSSRSWDSESKHDVEGEKMELQLIQEPQSAAGSSPHARAASILSDCAHGGTQPQGDGQQQNSGADHEEMELREIHDDF